jgi:hypothetical protein
MPVIEADRSAHGVRFDRGKPLDASGLISVHDPRITGGDVSDYKGYATPGSADNLNRHSMLPPSFRWKLINKSTYNI